MDWLTGFAFVFARLLALVWFAPLLGQRSVPVHFRIFLAIFLALAVSPMIVENLEDRSVLSNTAPMTLLPMLLNEVIAGSLMGVGILIIFSSSIVIGTAIGQMSGIQLDSFQIDSAGQEAPTTRIISIVAVTGFVLAGGLELMISSILDSFAAIPIGESIASQISIDLIIQLLQQSFEIAIRAVAPSVTALLLSTLLVGICIRVVPQLNLLQVGFSTNMAIMWIAILLTLGGSIWIVLESLESTPGFINEQLTHSTTEVQR